MARRCVKVALAKPKRSFSKEKIETLVPDKRKEKLTTKERALYWAKTGDKWDIYIHACEIGPKSNDEKELMTGYSQLSLFRNELAMRRKKENMRIIQSFTHLFLWRRIQNVAEHYLSGLKRL